MVGLYRTYGPAVYRRCLRLLRDREAARDATQEVFVKLLRDVERLAERGSALLWIYRVASNHCLDLQRRARRCGTPRDEGLDLSPETPLASPECRLSRTVLERFDPETRAVAVGVLVDGMEHGELASALGISRRTVRRKLTRFLECSRELPGGGGP